MCKVCINWTGIQLEIFSDEIFNIQVSISGGELKCFIQFVNCQFTGKYRDSTKSWE